MRSVTPSIPTYILNFRPRLGTAGSEALASTQREAAHRGQRPHSRCCARTLGALLTAGPPGRLPPLLSAFVAQGVWPRLCSFLGPTSQLTLLWSSHIRITLLWSSMGSHRCTGLYTHPKHHVCCTESTHSAPLNPIPSSPLPWKPLVLSPVQSCTSARRQSELST